LKRHDEQSANTVLRRNLLLGQIALKTDQIEADELATALSIQDSLHQDGISVSLGKICTDKGYLSGNALAHLLVTQRAGQRARRDDHFGNIALANGFIERAALKKALLLQRGFQQRRNKPAPKIGLILIQKEELTRAQVRAVLCAQARLRDAGEPRLPRSARFRQLYWYVADAEGPRGPLTDRELTQAVRGETIGAQDLVWREGHEDWGLAGNLSDFEDRRRAG